MIAQVLLIFFSVLALAAATSMLFLRHPMRVAMALITTMLSLASIFAILEIHVLAVFQILIYIGAIMVFMVYVIVLLSPHDTSFLKRFSAYAFWGSFITISSLIFLVPKISLIPIGTTTPPTPLGVVRFSQIFVTDYFLFFELSSVLLLVAVVCAVAVIKGRKHAPK